MDALRQNQVRRLSTPELLLHAIEQSRKLFQVEVRHAKEELWHEAHQAKRLGILLGVAAVLALCGLAALCVALGLSLPLGRVGGAWMVGAVLLAGASVLAILGKRAIPRRPFAATRDHLSADLHLLREEQA